MTFRENKPTNRDDSVKPLRAAIAPYCPNDSHQEQLNVLKHLILFKFIKESYMIVYFERKSRPKMASLYGPKERKAPSLSNQPSVYTFYPEGGVDWNVPYFGISIWRTETREQAVRAPTSVSGFVGGPGRNQYRGCPRDLSCRVVCEVKVIPTTSRVCQPLQLGVRSEEPSWENDASKMCVCMPLKD